MYIFFIILLLARKMKDEWNKSFKTSSLQNHGVEDWHSHFSIRKQNPDMLPFKWNGIGRPFEK